MTQNKRRLAFLFFLFFIFLSLLPVIQKAQLNPLALPQAKLTAAISSTDTTLAVDRTASFPASGQIAIGTEVLSYSGLTTNSITVAARAQASTTAVAHDVGSVVTFFPSHAGLLTASIDDKATSVSLNSTSTFPASNGAFIVDQEIIGYGGGTATTLISLIRAAQGTTAAPHNAGAVIVGRAAFPPVQTYIIPRMISASDNFSGIALANISSGPASITINPIKSDGTPVTVAGPNNTQTQVSKSITLNAHQQFVGGMFDLFGDLAGANDFSAQLSTGNPNVLGVVPIGNVDPNVGLNRLELAPISILPRTDVIIPIALQASQQYGDTVSLEVGIVAPIFPASITADFVDANGNIVQSTTLTPGGNQRLVKNLTDLFSNLKDQTVESGYIHLSSLTAFTAYEDITVGKENAYLEGAPRSNAAPVVNVPLAISIGPYQTRLVITDGTAAVAGQAPVGVVNARITAYNSNGSLLSGPGITNPAQVTFPVSGQYSKFVRDVFGLSPNQPFFGYLKVEVSAGSSSSGVLASALILHTGRNQLTAVPGQFLAKTNLTLTPALFDPLITSALSLVNPNSSNASVQIQILRGDGTLQASNTITVPALGQATPVLSNLFPSIGVASDGYIALTSSLPIFAMSVFDNGIFLASGYPIRLLDDFVAFPDPLNLATPVDSTVPASASTLPLTIQIPSPAPTGGFQITLHIQNSVIASISSTLLLIPEGKTSGTVNVIGHFSGATVLDISAPGFRPRSAVISVQNVSDFTLSRNVTISPLLPTVQSGGTVQFNLAYDTSNIAALVWRVAGVQNGQNAIGTITQNGFYTAPLLRPADQPLQVTVSANSNNTTFFGASTTVTILPPRAP